MVHKIVQNNILNINYIIDYFKQQIHMKVDPVINNNDELFISNMAQMQKIKYLQTQKYKRESYIKDLQQSLTLNKQSLSNLVQNNQAKALKNLNQQNILLHTKLKKYYQDCMNVNALLLIEQQVRMEQKKFYNERSLQFQTKMIQLRKYLQDKEDSFSSVVGRLKKYEDLAEVTLQTKLHKLSNQLAEQHLQSIFKKIAEERDRYKMVFEKFQVTIQDLSFLKKCLDDKRSYEVMQHAYLKAKQQQIKQGKQDKGVSFYEKTKNTTNASNTEHKNSQNGNGSSANVKNPHIQLIKLLKKQKLNNQILQQAFNQAIQKNQQLIDQNSILVQANIQLQINIQKLESKGYILEQELTRYDKSLALKQQWKTKCDIDRQERIKEFQQKGQQKQICMIAMQEDMEKLSSFLITCVPKGNLVKSSSNPNFARRNQDLFEESDDFDIEQL